MNIAMLGSGKVGGALALNLAERGHEVRLAARDPGSEHVRAITEKQPMITTRPIREAVDWAETVFLAIPFNQNEQVLSGLSFRGQVLVDCTNPVGPGLTHALDSKLSGGEYVQQLAPEARVVKAFSVYGYENFVDTAYPGYGGLRPAMLLAGDDARAKSLVAGLCQELGWDPVDCGPLTTSLHLEHMTLLWIKMARSQGLGPGFVWARLKRQAQTVGAAPR